MVFSRHLYLIRQLSSRELRTLLEGPAVEALGFELTSDCSVIQRLNRCVTTRHRACNLKTHDGSLRWKLFVPVLMSQQQSFFLFFFFLKTPHACWFFSPRWRTAADPQTGAGCSRWLIRRNLIKSPHRPRRDEKKSSQLTPACEHGASACVTDTAVWQPSPAVYSRRRWFMPRRLSALTVMEWLAQGKSRERCWLADPG